MKTNTIRTAMISLITVGLVAMGTVAFAGKGMGYRSDENTSGGYGYHQRNADCPYGRQAANLTDEQKNNWMPNARRFSKPPRPSVRICVPNAWNCAPKSPNAVRI